MSYIITINIHKHICTLIHYTQHTMSSPSRICPSRDCPKPPPGTSLIYKNSTIARPLKLSYQNGLVTSSLFFESPHYSQIFWGIELHRIGSNQKNEPRNDTLINPSDLTPECRDLFKRMQAVVSTADANNGKIRIICKSEGSPIIGISSISGDVTLMISDWRAEHYPDCCAWCGTAKKEVKKKTEKTFETLEDLAQSHKKLENDVKSLKSDKIFEKVKAQGKAIESFIRISEQVNEANKMMETSKKELEVLHAEAMRPITGNNDDEMASALICMEQVKIVNTKLAANQVRLEKLLEDAKVAQAAFNATKNLQFSSEDEDSEEEKSPPPALRRVSAELAAVPLVTVEDEKTTADNE